MPSIRGAWTRASSRLTSSRLSHRGVELGTGVRFFGQPIVTVAQGSAISIGERTVIISESGWTALGVAHPVVLRTMQAGSLLEIGRDVGISGGSICAAHLVQIGDGCLIGADVTIADTNFHPLASSRRRYETAPAPRTEDAVRLGQNVFVGTRAIILPGSDIGDDAVVGAGAVVRGRVNPGTTVIGTWPTKQG